MEGDVRLLHVLTPKRIPSSDRAAAARELLDVVKAYLR